MILFQPPPGIVDQALMRALGINVRTDNGRSPGPPVGPSVAGSLEDHLSDELVELGGTVGG